MDLTGGESYDEKYFDDGIGRKIVNNEQFYFYIKNNKEVAKNDLERIKKLKIPPNWTDVWVSNDPDSSIQAIGKDSIGRKQYRYHQVHIEKAEKEKFTRLYDFIKAIPKLEKVMMKDNNVPLYYKNRIISLMLQIVRDHHMRVGKEVYAKKNKSYGISSLRKKHIKIENGIVYLNFKGKSNQRLRFTIKNDFFVENLKMLMKLDGERLFQYIDPEKNKIYPITDTDLNNYIQMNIGPQFSIKDFRTYGANFYFIRSLMNETKKRKPKNRKIIKKNLLASFKSTAKQLKHTGAVSKKSYVMNFAIELYQNTPEFFILHKNDDPNDVLLTLLKMYKAHILE